MKPTEARSPSLYRNLVANTFGSGFSGILALIAVPLQARLLGPEQFGLFGLTTVIQAITSVMDLGLSGNITRVVAADQSPRHNGIRRLLQSACTVGWLVALLIAVGSTAASGALVDHWLRLGSIHRDVAVSCVRLIGYYVALRWPIAIYSAILSGNHRLDAVNTIKAAAAAIRVLGGVGLLLITPNVYPLLGWTVVSAVLELAIYVACSVALVPGVSIAPRFHPNSLRGIIRSSLCLNAVAVLTLIATQLDRLLISKLLPLAMLGYYSVAYALASGLSLITVTVSTAALPSFAASYGRGDLSRLRDQYSRTSQLLMFLLALPAAALFFFGDRCLALWISPQTAQIAGKSLKVLAVAFLLNGCSATAYSMSVAADKTTIPLRVNFFGTLLYVPVLLILIPRWGITGCAFAFLGFNAYSLLFFVPAVHRAVLQMSPVVWFRSNVFPFTAAACVLFSAATAFRSILPQSKLGFLETCCFIGALYAAIGFRILAEPTRTRILGVYHHFFRTIRT